MASTSLQKLELSESPPFVVQSEAARRLMVLVGRAAKSNASILIQGETGAGKEMVAHAIHHLSPRTKQPWVDINCAAIPEHLIESELFGHEKGAFSGADEMKRGMFELATGGTLFLDEVGELDARTQSKLLRVLDGMSYFRVGGTKKVSVDVRIVAATNRDLRSSVEGAKFRSDLFFRLSQIQLFVPPLRERLDDIEAIAAQVLFQCRPDLRLSRGTVDALRSYSWPGNIRELKNVVIATAVTLDPERNQIELSDLPSTLCSQNNDDKADVSSGDLDTMERMMIQRTLQENGGDPGASAQQLGISRRTMTRKMKAYQLEADQKPSRRPLGSLGSEQYRYFRVVLDRPVSLGSAQGGKVQAQAVNLSSTGIGIQLPAGTSELCGLVELTFDLGEPQSEVNVKGRISWADAHGNAGIRFVAISRNAQQLVDDWLTRKRVEEGWADSAGLIR